MGAVKTIGDAMDELRHEAKQSSSAISYSPLTVDHSLSVPDMTPRVIQLCKDLFKDWARFDDSRFSVQTVSGGITNLLLKVCVSDENGNSMRVTVRLYGPNTEYVIDREREFQAIKYLSAAGFGAKLLGVFGNGMVQSFIDARTLSPLDMKEPKLAAAIAKELNRFHQVEVPGSKEPQLWNDIFKFFENASTLHFEDIDKQSMYETISFKEVHKEIVELKELTGLLNAPVVFCHNDLLCGNLMLNEEQGKLFFIDFEYGSYNYRGYDIGNHFNEYAGYDCDYNLLPTKDNQFHFFRHYLQPESPDKVTEKDLEALYVESNAYMLASHLHWALWAIIQAKMSPIDFDYIGYFFLRYNEYKRQKEMCFALVQSNLSASRMGGLCWSVGKCVTLGKAKHRPTANCPSDSNRSNSMLCRIASFASDLQLGDGGLLIIALLPCHVFYSTISSSPAFSEIVKTKSHA